LTTISSSNSGLSWHLPERHQMPRPIGRRRILSQDIEIAVIRANFVKGIMWSVPLVQDLLDQVFMLRESKTNGPFIRFSAGVAIHLQLYILRLAHRDTLGRIRRSSSSFCALPTFALLIRIAACGSLRSCGE